MPAFQTRHWIWIFKVEFQSCTRAWGNSDPRSYSTLLMLWYCRLMYRSSTMYELFFKKNYPSTIILISLDISNDGSLYYFIPWKVKFYWNLTWLSTEESGPVTFHWRIWTWIPLQTVDSVDPDKSWSHVQTNRCSSAPQEYEHNYIHGFALLQGMNLRIPGYLLSKSNSGMNISVLGQHKQQRVVMDPKRGLNKSSGSML